VGIFDLLHDQLVIADLEGLAGFDFGLDILIESGAGEADEHEHDAHVDQVAAVSARVAMRQLNYRVREVDLVLGGDRAGAFEKFGDDCERYEEAEAERDERVEVTDSRDEQRGYQNARRYAGPEEVAA